MKKILVTGSNGLLGQTLTELITSQSRAELIATSKGANRFPQASNYQYVDLDICDKCKVEAIVSSLKPQVLINTAAMTNVDTCHVQKEACWDLNVNAVKNLIDVCEKHHVHLIHLSTDFVFDGSLGPYKEEDAVSPISFYGQSKCEAERLIQNAACKWTILRTILVYGVTAQMSRSNIVLWVRSSLQKGEQIKVVDDQWRMPTLAADLAEACLLAAEKEATGIFHISGKDFMTVHQIARSIAEFWNLDQTLIQPISSAALNQEAKRPLKTGFVLDKAIGSLGYKPHSFLEGLAVVDRQLSLL